MKKTSPKRAVVAGLAAGAIALGAPVAGIVGASVAQAQQTYAPAFSSKQYVNNVNSYAKQIKETLASSGKTVSDASLSEIFDIPFKDGKAAPSQGYKPAFSSAATGDTPAEIEEFKTRGFKLAQQLSDDDLKNAIAKIGANVDQNNAVEVPEATIDPNKPVKEVNEQPAPPVVNENSAGNNVASVGESETTPVTENPAQSNETVPENAEPSNDANPAPNGAETQAPATGSVVQQPAQTNTPKLANTGASVTALLALGGLASGAGVMALRRKK